MNQSVKTPQGAIALVACVLIIIAVIFSTNSSDSVSLKLFPKTKSAIVGETFNVDIVLNTAKQEIKGVDINQLRFNPSVLQVVDADTITTGIQITPGSLMDATVFNLADNTLGTVQFSQVVTPGSNNSNSYVGAGVLASITFKVIAEGTSEVTIDFTPGSSTDSNVAGKTEDLLTKVKNGSYMIE